MQQKPKIKHTKNVANSRIFHIESVDLEFSNGEQRTFERFRTQGYVNGAVLIVPVTEQNEIILVREYAVGVERYELNFPKGCIDPGESAEAAALRELKEESGFGAHSLQSLKTLALSPSYIQNTLQIFLATALYPEKLPGDEPESLEVVCWPLAKFNELLNQENFSGAMSVAALFLAREYLNDRPIT
jgi:ADP-ribose diphosphatase